MTRINDVYSYLCELAPLEKQMSFDNAGFQLGRSGNEVHRALLALDVTDDVVREAEELGAELIISHHPLIFTPVKNLTDCDAGHRRLLELAAKDIAVISMHTNLDIAEGGVNDVLIRALGAEPECALDTNGCGRVGTLSEEKDMESFLKQCKAALRVKGLRYYSAGRPVHRLAVMGGSGGDCVDDAYTKGCDTYVTADIKYHQFLHAAELGINLIDADHFCTEDPVMYSLRDKLSARFPETEFAVSAVHHQIIDFI